MISLPNAHTKKELAPPDGSIVKLRINSGVQNVKEEEARRIQKQHTLEAGIITHGTVEFAFTETHISRAAGLHFRHTSL